MAAGLRAPAGAGRSVLFCRRAHELDPRLAGRRSPLRPRSDRRNRQKGEEVAVARRVDSWLLCRPDTRKRNHLLMSTDPARSHSRDGRWSSIVERRPLIFYAMRGETAFSRSSKTKSLAP